jgi:Leucine-rich repeat (LRR) protein
MLPNNEVTGIFSIYAAFINFFSCREVNLSNNKLVDFPLGLCGLRNLNVVNLSNNRITQVCENAVGIFSFTIFNLRYCTYTENLFRNFVNVNNLRKLQERKYSNTAVSHYF